MPYRKTDKKKAVATSKAEGEAAKRMGARRIARSMRGQSMQAAEMRQLQTVAELKQKQAVLQGSGSWSEPDNVKTRTSMLNDIQGQLDSAMKHPLIGAAAPLIFNYLNSRMK